jgi:hypothetical protein
MEEKLLKTLKLRAERQKETDGLFKKLGKLKKNKLDDLFHASHNESFAKIDCLDCANCCKTTSPIFRDKDIERVAKHLKMKSTLFIKQYLKKDEDGDFVLQTAPCPFLWDDDHTCSIYEYRPLACREYPHTNRKNMYQILNLTKKNIEICPAVCETVNQIEQKIR